MWSNVLGGLFPWFPVWALLLVAALVTALAGVAFSWVVTKLSAPARVITPRTGHGKPSVGVGKLLTGPTASVLGSTLGLVIAGVGGQFVGNPLCALGFGAGQQNYSGSKSTLDWSEWRSVFIAGWIGSWVGDLTSQFAFVYLPNGAHILVTISGSTVSLPVSTIFGYVVGVVVAGIVRLGGHAVAIGSDTDTAYAGTLAGVVWGSSVVVLSLVLIPLGTLRDIAEKILGIGSPPALDPTIAAAPVALAGMFSLLLASLALPVMARRVPHASVGINQTPDAGIVSIETRDRGPLHTVGPGAFCGAVLALLFTFAFVTGTGYSLGSWTVFVLILIGGVCAGAVLFTVLGRVYSLADRMRAMEDSATQSGYKHVDELLTAPPVLQVAGELLFGAVTGLSVSGMTYYGLQAYFGRAPTDALLEGLVAGAVVSVLLLLTFRSAQRRSVAPFVRGRPG